MNRHARILAILEEKFHPKHMELIDDSDKHRGHAGAKPEGETHYRLYIESEAFRLLSRVAMHQAVYRALQSELDSGLHALAITAKAPEK